MPLLDPEPVGIDPIDPTGAWQQFRVDDLRKRLALLRELRIGDVQLAVGAPQVPAVAAALWAVDDPAQRIYFSADPHTPGLENLGMLPELWAAAYLGDVKLQFPVQDLRLAAPQRAGSLGVSQRIQFEAALPPFIYRLPRRHAYRVRHARHHAPQLRFRHPLAPEQQVHLSAVDISTEGCAMWKPASARPLAPGMLLPDVEVHLDERNVLVTDLLVQHVTPQGRTADAPGGARVGCSWVNMHETGRETLARWLQGNPQQNALMQLKFD